MNKRLFMKSLVATGVTALWSRGFSWTSEQKLTNWAGNIEYRTQRLYAATSLADVQRFVKTSPRFRVLGTRHCFNEIADTDKEFLSLRSLDKVIQLDRKAQTVTVEAGMSYGQLCPYLNQHGFALHNLDEGYRTLWPWPGSSIHTESFVTDFLNKQFSPRDQAEIPH